MPKATKQAKKQAQASAPYIRRLAEDKQVQEQLRNAAGALRTAYQRTSRKGGKAAEDKKVYASLREAATSLRTAAFRLQEPKRQPKRRLQKLGAAVLAAGSAVLVFRHQKTDSQTGT